MKYKPSYAISNLTNNQWSPSETPRWIADKVFFLLVPFGLFGFILNIACFTWFFYFKNNTNKFYAYLRVYTLNSSIVCLILSLSYLSYTQRFFDSITSKIYFDDVYKCVILNYIATSFFYFDNVLCILIGLERISLFVNKIRKLKSISAHLICFYGFMASFVINSPILVWFIYKSKSENELNQNENDLSYLIRTCGLRTFLQNDYGLSLAMAVKSFKGFGTVIVEIFVTLLALKYLNQFMNCQIGMRSHQHQINNNNSIHLASHSNKKDEIENKLKIAISLLMITILTHLIASLTYYANIYDALDNRKQTFNLITNFNYMFNYILFQIKLIANIFVLFYHDSNFRDFILTRKT
jgi:hypothetical protein